MTRRTYPAVTAVAATCMGALVALAPTAIAMPAADVSPSTVRAGEKVTVYVSCDTENARSITANSQAFARGEASLRLVRDNDPAAGGAYTGQARVAPANSFPKRLSTWSLDGNCPDGQQFSASFKVKRSR